jgi:transposase
VVDICTINIYIIVQMSSENTQELRRFTVAGIPLIMATAQRLDLRAILSNYVGTYGNESIPVVDTLMILLCNLTLGRQPLYELPQWVRNSDPRCFGLTGEIAEAFNDDRFARALDRLYLVDRASLMTEIVVHMIRVVDLSLARVHNDSTTIKAYGRIPGKTRTGLYLARGKSKDHRPDLKQLLFSLTISSDGAVPIHYKAYPGNRTDDTTHIETWKTIRNIAGTPTFLYVADCKVCTSKQLAYIVGEGGRVITTMPETWIESKTFKQELRVEEKTKRRILSRKVPGQESQLEYYSLFSGRYGSTKGEYNIYWYHSSEKKKNDRLVREQRLQKAERDLSDLMLKLNKRNLKTREAIEARIESILKERMVGGLYDISLAEVKQGYRVQIGRGRPGPHTKYKRCIESLFSLTWHRNKEALKGEARLDGVFPLLTTDKSLSAKDVLLAYKYQPRLEKRFTQFKSVHEAAPLLFKKIERVEAIMFLFFLSLMIQAVIEREVRSRMKERGIEALPIYPEFRDAAHPTTSKILDAFEGVSSYEVKLDEETTKEFRDSLTATQRDILDLVGLNSNHYWGFRPMRGQ